MSENRDVVTPGDRGPAEDCVEFAKRLLDENFLMAANLAAALAHQEILILPVSFLQSMVDEVEGARELAVEAALENVAGLYAGAGSPASTMARACSPQ